MQMLHSGDSAGQDSPTPNPPPPAQINQPHI